MHRIDVSFTHTIQLNVQICFFEEPVLCWRQLSSYSHLSWRRCGKSASSLYCICWISFPFVHCLFGIWFVCFFTPSARALVKSFPCLCFTRSTFVFGISAVLIAGDANPLNAEPQQTVRSVLQMAVMQTSMQILYLNIWRKELHHFMGPYYV